MQAESYRVDIFVDLQVDPVLSCCDEGSIVYVHWTPALPGTMLSTSFSIQSARISFQLSMET